MLVGSGAEALQIGNALMDTGVRIAAVVEQAEAITGPKELLARLLESGARLFTRHVIEQTVGDPHGVTAVRLAGIDGGRISTAQARSSRSSAIPWCWPWLRFLPSS